MKFDELMDYAREKGWEEGWEEGRVEGLEHGLEQGRKQGREQECRRVLIELLKVYGEIPVELRRTLESEKDIEKLRDWCRLAARVQSVSEFMDKM